MAEVALPIGRVREFIRRPVVGPLLFGFICGGIPCSLVLATLGEDIVSPSFFGYTAWLTPYAVLVSCVGAVLGTRKNLRHLLSRSLLASMGTCLPALVITTNIVAMRAGIDIFGPGALGGIITIVFFTMWMAVVTPLSWALASISIAVWRRWGRNGWQGSR